MSCELDSLSINPTEIKSSTASKLPGEALFVHLNALLTASHAQISTLHPSLNNKNSCKEGQADWNDLGTHMAG